MITLIFQPRASIVLRKGPRQEAENFSSALTWSLHGLQGSEGEKRFGISPLSHRYEEEIQRELISRQKTKKKSDTRYWMWWWWREGKLLVIIPCPLKFPCSTGREGKGWDCDKRTGTGCRGNASAGNFLCTEDTGRTWRGYHHKGIFLIEVESQSPHVWCRKCAKIISVKN